ncbi:hypothetical protein [Granulicoccus sp. GXG6511]|uniref:hypothetical protein n=1 Tax=Granulicoccus sp. GXG6511 TaxID=3381351 RepID=UPI003D7C5801
MTKRRPGWLVPVIVLGALLVGGLLVAPFLWLFAGPATTPNPDRTTHVPAEEPLRIPAGACEVGEPHFRGSGPADGELHGGGLAMPLPAGFAFGDPARMAYAFDVALVDSPEDESWAGVGALRIEEPYHTPEQASSTVTACLARAYADTRAEITDSAFVQLPGVSRAHERTGRLTLEGSAREFRVLVADTYSPESLAVYVRVWTPGSAGAAALADAERDLAKR